MNTLPYLLTASLYMALFYSCYWLVLRRNTFFSLNRAYLLGSISLSLVLPLIKLPAGTSDVLPLETVTLPAFTVGKTTDADTLTTMQWLWLAYALGVMIMLVRLGLNLRSVLQLIGSGVAEKVPLYTLVCLPDDSSPSFSFGRFLVLNYTDACNRPAALLRHEEAHIRQRHTLDVLFLEVVRIAFWFNPVLWLYKRSLQEIHEFLADRSVLQTPQPDYPHQLVAYALNIPSATLITPFVSKSTLKQRLIMLQKTESSRRSLLGYALALPLAALLVMCTQSEQDLPQVNSAQKSAKVKGEVFTEVEQHPQFPGGMQKLGEFLGENLKYPAAAQKAKIEGKVFVSFIVTTEGEITDVKTEKGIGFGADAEAVRVISMMPRWIPGKQAGQSVNVKYTMPIRFQLEESQSNVSNNAFKDVQKILIDGKVVSKTDLEQLSPNAIASMNVDKETKTISIITKSK